MIAWRVNSSRSRCLRVSGVLILAACGGKPAPRPTRLAVAVTVVPVRKTSVPYTIEANGVVTPMQTASVVAQVDGLVTEVGFAEGQNVTKGQVLFRVESRPYQAARDAAIAAVQRDSVTLRYAKDQSARYDSLLAERSVTREQADQIRATAASAEATVQADKAALETARFNLGNTTIVAPISGRTGSLLVHVGNVVHASGSQPLVVINQVQPTLVRFAVPASTLPMLLRYGVKGGLPVSATPTDAVPRSVSGDSTKPRTDSAGPGTVPLRAPAGSTALDGDDRGVLSFIDNAVDTTTGTVQLKASFPNRSGMLWAGQFVSTSLRLFVEEDVLVVPTSALVTGQAGTYVWVVDSAKVAHNHPVGVERTAGDVAVISSGVSVNDQVVVTGQSRLTPGSTVTIGMRSDSTPARSDTTGGRAHRKGAAKP